MRKRNLIDISPVVSTATAVFPGDTAFSTRTLLDFSSGSFFLSAMTTTPHLGAHADAPLHYHRDGIDISKVDLEIYYGPCQVIQVKLPPRGRIRPENLDHVNLHAERVLFRTDSFNPDQWSNDFNALSPELIRFLASKGVCLVGIDTPSVDLADDKILDTHLQMFESKMANLEGLSLRAVPEGNYTLIALPLKLSGLEASPVRAVLIEEGTQ